MLKIIFSSALSILLILSNSFASSAQSSSAKKTISIEGKQRPANEIDLETYEANYLKTPMENGLLPFENLNTDPQADQYLTYAEAVAIAQYTISYTREPRIMEAGAKKLPAKSGVFFRGQDQKQMQIKEIGQIIPLKSIISVSARKDIAQDFAIGTKKGELLRIKARTARDISKYSQGHADDQSSEEEHFLLPGVQLKVDEISKTKIKYFDEDKGKEVEAEIRLVDMSEIDLTK